MPAVAQKPPTHSVRWTVLFVAFIAAWLIQGLLLRHAAPREIAYSELLQQLHDGKVVAADVQSDVIVATVKDAEGHQSQVRAGRLPNVDDKDLIDELRRAGVKFSGHVERSGWVTQLLLNWVLPTLMFYGLWTWIARRRMGGDALGFGRSRAKLYEAQTGEPVTFADVAGVDDALGELREVVDFLRQPERYRHLGAHVPKGVLLVGPPGTGKTLLARAVAGEAGVPFFSITGSEFVEMFVGVGASRVRDLFAQAKERTPCIIFIDELDAVGRSRGGLQAMAVHDEREQTLNQLLAEIDGFDPARGIVLMAATNRPEILDPALLRAGRFDRRVVVDRPDVRGRAAILRVHARKVATAPGLDLDVIARRTAGMVGADLAGIVNEAALTAARRGSKVVEAADFEEAVDRVQLGARKKGRVMTEEDKRRVAYHEAGHALVALSVPKADPVQRVTILPRTSGALGATLQLPTDDRYLASRGELLDRLCVLLGGRAAEDLALGDISTGAVDDLRQATELARQMICRYGMGKRLGDQTLEASQYRFLEGIAAGEAADRSDATARIVDEEIRELLSTERSRAASILRQQREALERIAARLITVETIEREELLGLARPPLTPRRPQAAAHPA